MQEDYEKALIEQRLHSLKKRMFKALPDTPIKSALHLCAVIAYDNQNFSLKILQGKYPQTEEKKKG